MAKQSPISGAGIPIIGAPPPENYAIGDPEEDGGAVTLGLTVTPPQALQLFGQYMQQQRAKGQGPAAHFVLLWIFVSKGFNFVFRRVAALESRITKLEKKTDSP